MIAAELRGGKPSLNEALGWIGSRVDDIYGANVGRLEDVWIDPGTGAPRWLLVKEGRFGDRATLIPFEDATAGAGHVWVPYERDVVREAPEIEPGAPLTQQVETSLRAHYAANSPSAISHRGPAAQPSVQRGPHSDPAIASATIRFGEARPEAGPPESFPRRGADGSERDPHAPPRRPVPRQQPPAGVPSAPRSGASPPPRLPDRPAPPIAAPQGGCAQPQPPQPPPQQQQQRPASPPPPGPYEYAPGQQPPQPQGPYDYAPPQPPPQQQERGPYDYAPQQQPPTDPRGSYAHEPPPRPQPHEPPSWPPAPGATEQPRPWGSVPPPDAAQGAIDALRDLAATAGTHYVEIELSGELSIRGELRSIRVTPRDPGPPRR